MAIIRRLVGLLESVRANTQTHMYACIHRDWGGGEYRGEWAISRLAGGAVRQLLAFQKRLAPGSTVNNELILSARAQRNTPHLFWNKQSYSRPTLR